jgi:hypothetical protein
VQTPRINREGDTIPTGSVAQQGDRLAVKTPEPEIGAWRSTHDRCAGGKNGRCQNENGHISLQRRSESNRQPCTCTSLRQSGPSLHSTVLLYPSLLGLCPCLCASPSRSARARLRCNGHKFATANAATVCDPGPLCSFPLPRPVHCDAFNCICLGLLVVTASCCRSPTTVANMHGLPACLLTFCWQGFNAVPRLLLVRCPDGSAGWNGDLA